MLHLNYHRFSPAAITDGLIYRQGEQLFDVPNRPASPFLPGIAFAACPALERLDTLAATFVLKPEMLFSNTGKTLSYVEADFADGTGYRTLTWNRPIAVSWQHGGRKEITIRVHYTDSTQFTGRSYLILPNASQQRYAQTDLNFPVSASYGSQTSTGRVHVAYGCGNTALTKPIIIIDGLDFPQLPEEAQNTFASFLEDLDDPITQNFRQELEEAGYDLVYLDFDNGAEDIVASAQLLKQVINWVNQQKASVPGSEPNIVWGISRGGVVARWALKEMENQGQNHNASHVIYFDTPHKGANVPLGLQYMLKDVATIGVGGLRLWQHVEELEMGLEILNAPSTGQLLINQLGPPAVGYHYYYNPMAYNNFQQQLNSLGGLPQGTPQLPLRSISISNGSRFGQGQAGLQPGSLLFQIQEGWFLDMPGWLQHPVHGIDLGIGAELKFEIHALPLEGVAQRFYLGRAGVKLLGININLHNTEAATGSIGSGISIVTPGYDIKPYDTAPGGNQGAGSVLGQIPPDQQQNFYLNPNPVGFLPTLSSQNITNSDPYAPANPVMTTGSAFTRTSAPPYAGFNENNETHIAFSVGNTAILMDELITSRYGTTMHGTNVLTTTFNYGVSASGFRTSTRITSRDNIAQANVIGVNAGGVLAVNGNTTVAFPNSGWTAPVPSSLFKAIVPGDDCATSIIVNTGGAFQIGDNTNSLKGQVNFRSGSSLTLNQGSTLHISNNSRVTIDAGATFIISGMPNIILDGPDALLEIKGKLVISANSTFTFTGDGYVKFDLDPQIPGNIIVTNTSQLIFKGSGKTDKVLEVAANTFINPNNWGLQQITIEDGLVAMGDDAYINFGCENLTLTNVKFEGTNGRYRSVNVFGQGPAINNCTFTGAKTGLSGHLAVGAGIPLTLTNCTFTNYTVAGLHTIDKAANLNNCTFTGTAKTGFGWRMDGAYHWENKVQNSTFTNNKFGIYLQSSTGGALNLLHSTASANDCGVSFSSTGGTMRGKCTNIAGNNHGVRVSYGSLDLSNKSGFHITNNGVGAPGSILANSITMFDAYNLSLFNGQNTIYSLDNSRAGISGTFKPSSPVPALPNQLNCQQNKWHATGGAPANNPRGTYDFDVDLRKFSNAYDIYPQPIYHVEVIDPNPLTSNVITDCSNLNASRVWITPTLEVDADQYIYELMDCSSCETITTNSFTGDSLHKAVLVAASYSSIYNPLGNDYLAMNLLTEIIDYELIHPNEDTERIRQVAYQLLEEIYPRALDNSTNTTSIKQLMLNTIEERLENTGDTMLANPDYYRYMEGALTSYSAGSINQARAYIEQARPLSSFLNEEYLQYWDCLIGLKEQLRDSLITHEQMFDLVLACDNAPANARMAGKVNTMEYLRAMDEENQEPSIMMAQLVLSPNPASDFVEVAFVSPNSGRATIAVTDMGGRIVSKIPAGELNKGANRVNISLKGIASGFYTLHLEGENLYGVTKLVVAR